MSRRIQDILNQFDETAYKEKQKIIILRWLQQHPGNRFDVMEFHEALADELEVGQKTVSTRLNELVDDGILQTRGEQRIAYSLAEDIVIPIKFQIKAAVRHLVSIFHVNRWGIAGWVVMSGTIWGILMLPFWFFTIVLYVSPNDSLGSIHQIEIFQMTIAMSLWLLVYILLGLVLHSIQQRWGPFNIPWPTFIESSRK